MFKHLLTESDNCTYCIARVGLAAGIVAAIVLEVYNVVELHKPFDIQAFGVGFGMLLTGGGAAAKLKPESEVIG